MQNYPNPFNAATTIRFSLGRRTRVTLSIFNIAGQLVKTIVGEEKEAGNHQAAWSGRDREGAAVGSGVYFYRLSTADGFSCARAMVLLK
jgi:flagellar hook assembly protein FlgD